MAHNPGNKLAAIPIGASDIIELDDDAVTLAALQKHGKSIPGGSSIPAASVTKVPVTKSPDKGTPPQGTSTEREIVDGYFSLLN